MFFAKTPRRLFLSALQPRTRRRRSRPKQSAPAGLIRLESLENRVLLTNFTVDTVLDDASGVPDGLVSLREAMIAADTNAAFGDAPAGMADGDTIKFDPALSGMTIAMVNGEFSISEDLSIDGGDSDITIDAAFGSRIFDVDTSETVEISNLSLTNGAVGDNGGAIALTGGGTSIYRGLSITNSTASGDGGGAIFNDDHDLTIIGSSLVGNTADGASGSGGALLSNSERVRVWSTEILENTANRAGGGIEVIDGTVLLNDVDLSLNVAGPMGTANPGNGGGLHVTGVAEVTVRDSLVEANFAASEGGGLWNQSDSMLRVLNSEVSGNEAAGDAADNGGGGIFNNGGVVAVNNSDIFNNTATGDSGSGGGIFSTDGRVLVWSSSIDNNTANRAGGGIEVVDGQVKLVDVDLNANVAGPMGTASPGNGGGLHVTGVAEVIVRDSFVLDNYAAREGGGLWNQEGSLLRVINSQISDNEAAGDAADDGGGGIFNNGGIVVITSSTISSNVASGESGSGGGIFSTDGRILSWHSSIERNTANRAGGGIEVVDGEVKLTYVDLSENVAGPDDSANPGNGGGLHVSGDATVRVYNSWVNDNYAAKEGGGLWNQSGATMYVYGSEVLYNEAAGDEADDGGGGIFNNGGLVIISSSDISENAATGESGSGGGIFSTDGRVSVNYSTIAHNEANRAGGGAEVVDGDLILYGVYLIGNVAGPDGSANPGNGGGVHVSGENAFVFVKHSTVLENFAAREGGGLWNQEGSRMVVIKSDIVGNEAAGDAADDGGGGIFNNGGSLLVEETFIIDNVASGESGSGGGIFSTDGNVLVTSSKIVENFANRAGGGIEVVDGDFEISWSLVGWNVAGPDGSANPGNGGGLHVTGSEAYVAVLYSGVKGNYAASEGGGLWNQSGSTMEVIGSDVRENYAAGYLSDQGGGGIFNNGGYLYIEDSLIVKNHSYGSGGGLFLASGSLVDVIDSHVSHNRTEGHGGGIYNDGDLYVFDSQVAKNRAGGTGGGIYTDFNGITDVDSSFVHFNFPRNFAGPGPVV